jgi:hypothetical protein
MRSLFFLLSLDFQLVDGVNNFWLPLVSSVKLIMGSTKYDEYTLSVFPVCT